MTQDTFEAPGLEQLAQMLPNFEFKEFIAQGGMGAVYRARQKSLDRDVAIKILPREFGDDKEFRESFETEAKAMARLNHPNLVGVFDYGDVDGMPYIVMEYVDGNSLYSAAQGQPVDPMQAVDIVYGVCQGIGHAHENGVVHRDLKPANILLTLKAESKIGDFGLARPEDHEGQGLFMGTPGYAAPEVFDRNGSPDSRVDIFAIGVILHELLTGIRPDTVEGPPSKASGNLKLDAIWRKATQANPALRYQTAEELAHDLETWKNSPAAQSHGKLITGATIRGGTAKPTEFRKPKAQALPSAQSDNSWLVWVLLIAGIIALLWVTIDLLTGDNDSEQKKVSPGKNSYVPAQDDLSDMAHLLERIRQSLDSASPIFPKGSVELNGRHYFVVRRPISRAGAVELAQRAGGQLASPASDSEAAWLSNVFKEKADPAGYWIGAYRQGVRWSWDSEEPWDDTAWADGANPLNGGKAVVLIPGRGWLDKDPSATAAGAVIEWQINRQESSRRPMEESPQDIESLKDEYLSKATERIQAVTKERDERLAENVNLFKDSLDQWLNSLPEPEAVRYGDDVEALKGKAEKHYIPSLHALREDPSLGISAPMTEICENSFRKQAEIESAYQMELGNIRDRYLSNLVSARRHAKRADNRDLAHVITTAMEDASDLDQWIASIMN